MKKILIILSVITVLVAIPFMAACAKPAAPEPIVLKSVSWMPRTNAHTAVYVDFLDLVTERANGELVIEYLGAQEVIPMSDQATAIKEGKVDMTNMPNSMYQGFVPEARMITLSKIMAKEEREGGWVDLMRERFAEAGFFYLGRSHPTDPLFVIALTKKVDTPYELEGLKLGATAPVVKPFAEALGMSNPILPMGESYTALDTGVVDAWCTGPSGYLTWSMDEVITHIIEHKFYSSAISIVMSLDSWNKLPAHLQKLVEDTYLETKPAMEQVWYDEEGTAMQKLQDAGVEMIQFSPEDAKWYIDLAYQVEIEKALELSPEYAPQLLKLAGFDIE